MADCALVGVPAKTPVEVLKVIPDGAAGEIVNVSIEPPTLRRAYPTLGLPKVMVSEEVHNAIDGIERFAT